jgi:hypothetical protein
MRPFDDALLIFQDLGDRRSEAMLLLERSDALLLLDIHACRAPARGRHAQHRPLPGRLLRDR